MPAPNALQRRVEKLTSILDVAKELAAARELDPLLRRIAEAACKVADADRCTLYVLDKEKNELWSKVARGASAVIRIPLGAGLAGTVAQTGDIINIADAYADPRFNATIDKATGYRTQTVLCVPMRDAQGDIVGVLQVLNKHDGHFTGEDEELLVALGGQAAGAIENAILHDEINRLFEGFVSASVVAIESRDPTTAGHSDRVARLTVALAEAVQRDGRGAHQGLRFSDKNLKELRYASLLHDFGKVGVREPVLVKANKLYPEQLAVLEARFAVARKDHQLQSALRKLERLSQSPLSAATDGEENRALEAALRELDALWEFVVACNRPAVLEQRGFERLKEVAGISFLDAKGQQQPLLASAEVALLSIPKGSLSEAERLEIESHVTHTFRFLSLIPWTRELQRVPSIAYAHHERADGRGYPLAISGAEIPVQSKMMAIADVYDALTASDRPYKRAVPHALALDIIGSESKSGKLDAGLFEVFTAARIPKQVLGHS
ncbi:MAG: HD domain-containing phosphohydrolase [Myxococcaceae bacterium]